MRKSNIGMYGERCVARFLRDKGYRILSANYRTRLGEIDIIACDSEYIMFVEVKTRGESSIALPREFVDSSKQKKIISTANIYMSTFGCDLQPRYDVAEVYLDKNGKAKEINYIENAFDCDGY